MNSVVTWFQQQAQFVTLSILAKPNAKRSTVIGIHNDRLQIALQAQPLEGAANKELIAFLAKFFRIPKSQIVIIRGEQARHKIVKLPLTEVVQQFLIENS